MTEQTDRLVPPKLMTVDDLGRDHKWCAFSTGIDDDLTAGQGQLGWHGFFAIPCPRCEREMRIKLNNGETVSTKEG